jgi:predicted glycogen debranching enzyme
VYQYLQYTNDIDLLKTVFPTLKSIIKNYRYGTSHGIHMDEDCLISHDPGLTWMDVKLGNYYSTPRAKKAVEIQALWYNALSIMDRFAIFLNEQNSYRSLAEKVKKNFRLVYDQQYDVIDTKDLSLRPNKIFLVSLPYSMISRNLQERIVEDIRQNLHTTFGLRTLAPSDQQYKGFYLGNYHRDIAYHNGVVWPWLLGPFITGFVKIHHHDKQWRKYAYNEFIEPLIHVYGNLWDGSIHEIFDGDFPYAPQGCISQAWSVAEILRSWIEEIEYVRPPFEHIFT